MCVESEWLDTDWFRLLRRNCYDQGRLAMYLVRRAVACDSHAGRRPLVWDGNWEEEADRWSARSQKARAELARMGDAAVLAWATELRSPSIRERELATDALTRWAGDADVLNLLIIKLHDPAHYVRRAAAVALRNAHCEGAAGVEEALPFLAMHVLHDASKYVRTGCADAIGEIAGVKDQWPHVFLPDEQTVEAARAWIRDNYDLAAVGIMVPGDESAE
jgi:hypothetical protein